MDILQETDTFHPLLLNIGYAIHHSDWNWTEVNSPFFRIYYVTKGMAEVTLPDRTITLSPHHLYIICGGFIATDCVFFLKDVSELAGV